MCSFCVLGHYAKYISNGFVNYLGSHWLGAPGLSSSSPLPAMLCLLATVVSCKCFQLSVKDTGLFPGMFFFPFYLDNSLHPSHLNSSTASSGSALLVICLHGTMNLLFHHLPADICSRAYLINICLAIWPICSKEGGGHPGRTACQKWPTKAGIGLFSMSSTVPGIQ